MTNVNLARAVTEDMRTYAAEVNFNRAIVDISGLKRVQLRILYTMYKMKLFPDKPYAKCPDIVGNVIKLHPHAETSIYDALVRMAQPWTLNYPLIDFNGNCGTEDGDPAAASRYTSARLSLSGYQLIRNIEDTSPFVPDYSDSTTEPEFLVPAFPALFVNISKGIGVAAACDFLPHSIGAISKVINQRMDNVSEDEILKTLLPTFPTGGVLVNGADLPGIYKRGRGSVLLRAKYKIEGNKIIFSELPYQISRTSVIEGLQKDAHPDIVSIYDTSDMKQKSLTIEVSSGTDKESLVEELFNTTRLQSRFNVNMTIHDRKKVENRSFVSLIDSYIEQQHGRIIHVAEAEKKSAEEKTHKLEGLIIALSNIDRVIEIVKTAGDQRDAVQTLCREFKLTEVQALSILAIKLSQLTKRGVSEIEEEIAALKQNIEKQINLIENAAAREAQIREEVNSLKDDREFTMEVQRKSIVQNLVGEFVQSPFTLKYSPTRYFTEPDGGYQPGDDVVIVTNQVRGFIRKGSQFLLGESPWGDLLRLNEGEKVALVIPKKELEKFEYVELKAASGETTSLHSSFISVGASPRGKKLVRGKYDIESIKLLSRPSTFPKMK